MLDSSSPSARPTPPRTPRPPSHSPPSARRRSHPSAPAPTPHPPSSFDYATFEVAFFALVDDIIARAKPRKVLYLAVDGIAPRAKLAQQRQRRFRSAAERSKLHAEAARLKEARRESGLAAPVSLVPPFDTNAIKPRTLFMVKVAASLRKYVKIRLEEANRTFGATDGEGASKDPSTSTTTSETMMPVPDRAKVWSGLAVILSDDSVPGEGEHKLLKFIRAQRCLPDHDPSTHHCLVGSDADLILLARKVTAHEPPTLRTLRP